MTDPREHHGEGTPDRLAWLGRAIGRTRLVVLVAVVAVLLVAFSLFLIGALQAIAGVFDAWSQLVRGGPGEATALAVRSLEIVAVMLKAVVFYLIGVGLYSLFIAPLNVAVSLGVETLHDLETKVVNVVVVILAVTFLEHFILWEDPMQTLQFAAALAAAVIALVAFQLYSHRVRTSQHRHDPDAQVRAKQEMFEHDVEQHEVLREDGGSDAGSSPESAAGSSPGSSATAAASAAARPGDAPRRRL